MTKEEFKKDVLDFMNNRPENWRKGQAVFNYIDSEYGVARSVQFEDKIDCFYHDEAIDDFIEASAKRLQYE